LKVSGVKFIQKSEFFFGEIIEHVGICDVHGLGERHFGSNSVFLFLEVSKVSKHWFAQFFAEFGVRMSGDGSGGVTKKIS
jgi:hypothetical protein